MLDAIAILVLLESEPLTAPSSVPSLSSQERKTRAHLSSIALMSLSSIIPRSRYLGKQSWLKQV